MHSNVTKEYTPLAAIKEFFSADGGRPCSMEEMKALSKTNRIELAELAVAQLGGSLKV